MKERIAVRQIVVLTIMLLASLTHLNVKAPDGVSIVNVQLKAFGDAHVEEIVPNMNFGSEQGLLVESYPTGDARVFIVFDLSSVPPGSYVTYARLFLYMYVAPDVQRTYECDRIVNPWSETGITWDNQPGVEGLGESTALIGTAPNVDVSWDVKNWVQNFVSGSISATPNHGWRIKDKSENSLTLYNAIFRSREYGDPHYVPVLTMSYYPPHLELETYGSAFAAGNWVKMTVHRKDYSNIPVARGELKVKLSSTSTSANKKFSLTQGGAPITELTIEDGSSSKDFWYYDDKAGTWTIRVWNTDYVNYGDDSEQQTVNPGALDRFTFAAISSPKTAGVSFSMSIVATDAYGNTVTGYTGTNSLSDTTGTVSPTVTGAFVGGIWSGNVVINKVASNVKISTSGGGKAGESNVFNVVAGPPAKLLITPSSFTMAAGVQYSSLTIALQDANGFETTAAAPITVSLATASPDGEFRQAGTTTKITSVTLPAGLSSATVDYYDIKGGTWTLTASAAGLTSGTSIVTVVPDTTPPVTTIIVGLPRYQVGATLYTGGMTTIELSATDEASGVKETKYRVDVGSWNTYTGALTLSSYPDGSHTIGYYSIDKAGNNEAEKTLAVFLDKTPPSASIATPTGDVFSVSMSVEFKAAATDTGSGVKEVSLIVDGAPQGSMDRSGAVYTKTVSLAEGSHLWSIEAIDNLDNRAAQSSAFNLRIDNTPPSVSSVSVSPTAPVFGESIRVSCQVSDAQSGVKEVNLYYSTDGGVTWTKIVMIPPMPPSASYQGSIPAQWLMIKVQYYIEASDVLENAARSTIQEFTVGIPVWLYAIVAILIIAVALKLRKRPQPMPPPPPPST